MNKRIIALFLALIFSLCCLPFTGIAEETAGDASATSYADTYEADDFALYGTDEEYAIVPCNAGSSCVDDGGTGIQLWKTHRRSNQIWTLGKVGDYYYIKSKANGRVVDVPNNKAESGRQLQTYDYHGGNNQLWRLESMGDGTYCIHSKLNDSFVWDVWGDSWDNGSAIALSTKHGRQNQRFRLIHTSTVEPMSEWGSSRQDCNGSDWSVWDGSCNYDWYYNHRNETDLYINSAAEFFGLASFVANGYEMLGKTIHLTRNINLAGIQWTPIGFYGHWFRGSFNGHNHAIIGLNRVDTSEGSDYTGLFGMVAGGTICNLAVKGTIAGDEHTGGIVGILQYGHLCNIYSEVNVPNCTDIRQGGICGAVAYGGLVDHCTQNATVNSTDADKYRGGIAGYSDGMIRYSVNNANVNHSWDCGGGIAGGSGSGIFEYCANHGTVSGGTSSEYIGGIVGDMNGGIIFGCYNDGTVRTSNNDYVGGIAGRKVGDWNVICCINDGRVYGDDYIGGICGEGRPIKCLNTGVVTGDDQVGAISGNAKSDTPWCYALAWSSEKLNGASGSRAEWIVTTQLLSGEVCYLLNCDPVTNEYYGITSPLTQNIGSDPMPTFGSSAVTQNGSTYSNGEFCITAEVDRGYGSVEGAGSFKPGEKVTLTAKPAAGCVFDRFEVKTAETGSMNAWNGSQVDYPNVKVTTYKEETIDLTMDRSYTVRAVFKVFDETPEDMKVTVRLELECTNEVDGWNNDSIPVALVDSAGVEHHWNTNKNDLNTEGAKVSHTFDLGTASPIAIHVNPNFGGGFTFHDYGLKARIWVNGSDNAMESPENTINSYPFASSVNGDNYMHISFENYGNSTVGGESFTKCSDAWNKARESSNATVVLTSAWLLDSPLRLEFSQSVTVDLNGYPIIRTVKKTQDEGELFYISEGATLTFIDSTPTRQSCGNFKGGSIQGGRSNDTGGLIECKGTLNMTGGTLYNGGTTDKGGAIKMTGRALADLSGVLISNCWSDKAVTYQNEGGAIYMSDNAQLTLKNCVIRNCRALDYGGAIYMED
ncbi:MAG: RICIN domain-containing protein, partial [Clostridia bacterium]|nr:RICIN domain-containing protein [Clostridia bacterium]